MKTEELVLLGGLAALALYFVTQASTPAAAAPGAGTAPGGGTAGVGGTAGASGTSDTSGDPAGTGGLFAYSPGTAGGTSMGTTSGDRTYIPPAQPQTRFPVSILGTIPFGLLGTQPGQAPVYTPPVQQSSGGGLPTSPRQRINVD